MDGYRERARAQTGRNAVQSVFGFSISISIERVAVAAMSCSSGASFYLIVSSPSSHRAMVLVALSGRSIICAVARSAAISAMYVVSAKW